MKIKKRSIGKTYTCICGMFITNVKSELNTHEKHCKEHNLNFPKKPKQSHSNNKTKDTEIKKE